MSRKMPARLVALSTSAVATIYVAGLLSTQPTAQTLAAAATADPTATTQPVGSAATSAPSVVVGASATATPAATATSVPTPTSAIAASTAASTYADGTYSATGTSQLGNVTVSVTIASDRITNVQITRVTTKFPMSRIASLPSQVIQSQSASVNVVTGATYSSQAFKQAIQQALTQAHAAATA